jgi:ABC-type enterochelin transport system ATPase subunit
MPDYKTYLNYLKEAKEKKLFVNVTLASAYSDTIVNVKRGKVKNE